VRPGKRYPLGEQCLIPPGTLSGLGDGAQVGEVFHAGCFRVEFIGECLETTRRFFDLRVSVLDVITSSSKETVELRP
jgi:hypothetical protein